MKLNQVPEVPCVVNGERFFTGQVHDQIVGCEISRKLCTFHLCTQELIDRAISGALAAKSDWANRTLYERASIFLRAADLLTTKYRYQVMAATMLGQGKNVWQAEIDSIAELADFWRFNCKMAEKIYDDQPVINGQYTWNRLDYRPLDGFVYAVSPFNFTAIGGNLCTAPALMGNVVLWKPSSASIYSNYLVYQVLLEAGLPPGVIQFIPAEPAECSRRILRHPQFSGLHFTGSGSVFKALWKEIGNNLDLYASFPKIVGETGGKNMHFIHSSANLETAINQTIRGAFEYQGQKCSACSRVYVPSSLAEQFIKGVVDATKEIRVGHVSDLSVFMSAVINKAAYDKIVSHIDAVRSSATEKIVAGGGACCKAGYFVDPTVVVTTDPHSAIMREEVFGPVLAIYVYPDQEFEHYLAVADSSTEYALTGSIFATDRTAIETASRLLRFSAGNLYVNDKSTGAIVGQQPFGGARMSGTNDKAGCHLNLLRWTSPRTIKETFTHLTAWKYPSNQ